MVVCGVVAEESDSSIQGGSCNRLMRRLEQQCLSTAGAMSAMHVDYEEVCATIVL